jgi:D-3-phosphoglycerate dehydrogenase
VSDLVVITDSDLGAEGIEEAELGRAGVPVRRLACRTEDDVVAAVGDARALIVQWAPVTARALDTAPRLCFISRLGIGYDMIDVEAATARGIAVANTPDYCVEEVVAHTVALVLALARGVVAYDRAVRAGDWSAVGSYPGAARPRDLVCGIVGLGRIGRPVATALAGLGFRCLGVDPVVPAPAGVEPADLETLLGASDVVTLHAPLTQETRHLIDAAALARMRPGALLVNTCRGGLVDEQALADALSGGHLAGAALDVFESEPLSASSPLRGLENVILSPHAAWYSPTALAELPRRAAAQVVDFLAGRAVPSIVNPDYRRHVPNRA